MLAYLKRTTVKVDDEVDSQMRQEAARRGLALSDWVREAVVAHLPSGSVTAGQRLRIAELVAHNRDLPLGMVNSSVVGCAERRGLTEVATTDRRYFAAVRPRHRQAFDLLP